MIITPEVDNKRDGLVKGCFPRSVIGKCKCVSKHLGIRYDKEVVSKRFKTNQYEVHYSNYEVFDRNHQFIYEKRCK